MPNSKTNMVDQSKNNSSANKTNTNADLKHNNSVITKNNNHDVEKSSFDSKTNIDDHGHAQGDVGGGTLSPQEGQSSENQHSLNGNKVYKSGPLFLSSKGIGWTSWKKRWFVLTQTSLVFFRSDPNAATQRGGEVNLTLGGIDLNSSGSVAVKADKKLLTVSFPDGRDGRSFTLKAETIEDLNEWKVALEEALANAPTVSLTAGQSGTIKIETGDTADGSLEHSKDQGSLGKQKVLGCPVLLALEDADGTPSFLEKALRYVEDHGVKVEGILRQAADVEDVERRIREYEQGKVDFTAEEDAHVIGDCIKYVLRELPSSPVPASCCTALLDAYRTDRVTRLGAMRTAICETFPEPNRRLLQRMLIMMEAVAENKTVNRMSVSAVAACMAPLLLRPLLAGECNLDSQFNMGGDGSAQLMQAAAAANHAQAIVITLLEEYDNIFGEEDMLSDLYSDSEELGSESEELSEDEIYEDDDSGNSNSDEDSKHSSTSSQSVDDGESYQKKTKRPVTVRSHTVSYKVSDDRKTSKKLLPSSHVRSASQVADDVSDRISDHLIRKPAEHAGRLKDDNIQLSTIGELTDNAQRSSITADSHTNMQHNTSNRTDPDKNTASVDAKESEVKRPEATKEDSKAKTEAEDFLSKKKALEKRRMHLEQDVARLEEQLRKELDLRKKLENGIMISQQALSSQFSTIEKAESGVNSFNQKIGNHVVQSSSPGKVKESHEATTTSRESKEMHSSKDSDGKYNLQSYSAKVPPNPQSDPINDIKKSFSSKSKG